MLAYTPEDREWQAIVAMRDLLRELYTDAPPHWGPAGVSSGKRVPGVLLQGRLPVQLPAVPGGGRGDGGGQCSAARGGVGGGLCRCG